jgi:hypothetical protein
MQGYWDTGIQYLDTDTDDTIITDATDATPMKTLRLPLNSIAISISTDYVPFFG